MPYTTRDTRRTQMRDGWRISPSMDQVSRGPTWSQFGTEMILRTLTKQECAHSAFGGHRG
eukprot:6296533-Amphidinium_carterae.2